jgi:hypothetical protein
LTRWTLRIIGKSFNSGMRQYLISLTCVSSFL